MQLRLASLLMLAVLAAGCGRDAESENRGSPTPSPSFPTATAIIETREGPVLLEVEIAQTEEQRTTGLMGRESLPADAGMVFLFFEGHSGGFWMKNTHIPLSIAFFDVDGKILRILDMAPCTKDPCRVYDPGVSYFGALEVNQGAFDEWGVKRGDTIRVSS